MGWNWLWTGDANAHPQTLQTSLEGATESIGSMIGGHTISVGPSLMFSTSGVASPGLAGTFSLDLTLGMDKKGLTTWGFSATPGLGVGYGWAAGGDGHVTFTNAPNVATLGGWGNQAGIATQALPVSGDYIWGDNGAYQGITVGFGRTLGHAIYYSRSYTWQWGDLGTYRPLDQLPASPTSGGRWEGTGNLFNQGP
jgi:hypothetical protein